MLSKEADVWWKVANVKAADVGAKVADVALTDVPLAAAYILRVHRPLSYLGYIGRFRPKISTKNFSTSAALIPKGHRSLTTKTSVAFGRLSSAFIQTSAALSNIGRFDIDRFDFGRFQLLASTPFDPTRLLVTSLA